jgi:hypothetical protein
MPERRGEAMPRDTNKATRRANRTYPPGTLVLYVNEDAKYRFGVVLGARAGRVRIRTPPIPKRKTRAGVTPAMARAVAHVDSVAPEAILRVEREAQGGAA